MTLKCSGCKIPPKLHTFGKPGPHCNAAGTESLPSPKDDCHPPEPENVKGTFQKSDLAVQTG